MDTRQVVADNVRRLMETEGWSQRELARRASKVSGESFSQSSISRLLNPEAVSPTTLTLFSVAAAFRVPPWQLFISECPLKPTERATLDEVVTLFMALPGESKRSATDMLRYLSRSSG